MSSSSSARSPPHRRHPGRRAQEQLLHGDAARSLEVPRLLEGAVGLDLHERLASASTNHTPSPMHLISTPSLRWSLSKWEGTSHQGQPPARRKITAKSQEEGADRQSVVGDDIETSAAGASGSSGRGGSGLYKEEPRAAEAVAEGGTAGAFTGYSFQDLEALPRCRLPMGKRSSTRSRA
ncbi:unnamed protein product [Urochloa humidicola]